MNSDFLTASAHRREGSSTSEYGENSDLSSSSTRSTSPMVSFDLPLDPSDPLAFLINGAGSDHSGDSSSAEDSYVASSTPPSSHDSPSGDWLMPSGGDPANFKSQPFPFLTQELVDSLNSGYGLPEQQIPSNDALVMALASSGVPNAPFFGQFDPSAYLFNFNALANPVHPYQQSQDQQMHMLNVPERRLSVTSSSSSGASMSSVGEHSLPETADGSPRLSGDRTIDELTQRARQMVGVSRALPGTMIVSDTADHASKLPIPRLQRPADTDPSSNKRRVSTSTASSASPPPSVPAEAPPAAPQRTKTSHTTIERRYRTNINSRIQSLRAAVPALRVLELKDGNRVGNLNIKSGTRGEGDVVDVVDDRGFVDGVKVARKGSKANVLGKAVEYIRVLKRRELRLKREQDGLRSLISSLMGGPALLKEWETMWKEKFGGPETDEVDGEDDGEADDENDEDEEEGDEMDPDGDDLSGAGKKRKRSRVDNADTKPKAAKKGGAPSAAKPSFSVAGPGGAAVNQPEKRKRGRPRKVPVLPATLPLANGATQDVFSAAQTPSIFVSNPFGINDVPMQVASQGPQHQQPQPPTGQYLLAAFAFFSFFNSPVSYFAASSMRTSNDRAHTHTGSVLISTPDGSTTWSVVPPPDVKLGWRDAVQIMHVFVSFLLFLSIVGPWLPRMVRVRVSRLTPRVLKPLLALPFPRQRSLHRKKDDDATSDEDSETENNKARTVLSSALSHIHLSRTQQATVLREALGLKSGLLGLVSSISSLLFSSTSRSPHGLERRMLEQKAFLRLADLIALDESATFSVRVQIYVYAFKFISMSSASVSNLATLALIVRPFWPNKSSALWELALDRAQGKNLGVGFQIVKSYEALVLGRLSVDEAAERIAQMDLPSKMSSSLSSYQPSDPDSEDSDEGQTLQPLPQTPLALLASSMVHDYLRKRAENVFLQAVLGDANVRRDPSQGQQDAEEREREMQLFIAAGKSLDSGTAELMALYDIVCGSAPSSFQLADASQDGIYEDYADMDYDGGAPDSEIRSLLLAVSAYRHLYPSAFPRPSAPSPSASATSEGRASGIRVPLLPTSSSSSGVSISVMMPSPPPSPSRDGQTKPEARAAALRLSLRRRLASSAFDRSDALEDARDMLVDLLESDALTGGRTSGVEY